MSETRTTHPSSVDGNAWRSKPGVLKHPRSPRSADLLPLFERYCGDGGEVVGGIEVRVRTRRRHRAVVEHPRPWRDVYVVDPLFAGIVAGDAPGTTFIVFRKMVMIAIGTIQRRVN